MGGGGRQFGRRFRRVALASGAIGFAVLVYVYLTLPDVRVLTSTNPSSTAFMEQRALEAARDGRAIRRVQEWVPYARISEDLKHAVLVAEDAAFWDHDGIDITQIRESIEASWTLGVPLRGASTITQQLAKNLYLSPTRDPLRKLRELVLARRLEAALSKVRIFEVYLNVIEWGDGIWGVEAAARAYFRISASALDTDQSALLAGAIINPRLHNPARPTTRLLQRQQIILGRMGQGRRATEPVVAVVAEPLPVDEGLQDEEVADPIGGGSPEAETGESVPVIDDVPSESAPPTESLDTTPLPMPAPFPSP
jgi:monofunctional biosynthetic peptidoglycan transglycosylase